MAGIKSVCMFHDIFHENSGHNKDDREGLSAIQLEYFNKEQDDYQLYRNRQDVKERYK